MAPMEKKGSDPEVQDFARLVDLHYKGLYRVALTLTHSESESCDLVQQTFYLWATHGRELRDPRKVKSWLFTTIYREFLRIRRRRERFPHQSLDETEAELPQVTSQAVNQMDWRTVVATLEQVDEVFRAPLAMFYLEDNSYQEIAEARQIPMGTVMSRISRGRAQLQELLLKQRAEGKVIRFPTGTERGRHEYQRSEDPIEGVPTGHDGGRRPTNRRSTRTGRARPRARGMVRRTVRPVCYGKSEAGGNPGARRSEGPNSVGSQSGPARIVDSPPNRARGCRRPRSFGCNCRIVLSRRYELGSPRLPS